MDFYIRKNATEPILKMKVIQDGKNDYQNFHDQLDTNKTGRYQGEFSIYLNDDCAELIVPIRDELYINISDSFARSNCANCTSNT